MGKTRHLLRAGERTEVIGPCRGGSTEERLALHLSVPRSIARLACNVGAYRCMCIMSVGGM